MHICRVDGFTNLQSGPTDSCLLGGRGEAGWVKPDECVVTGELGDGHVDEFAALVGLA